MHREITRSFRKRPACTLFDLRPFGFRSVIVYIRKRSAPAERLVAYALHAITDSYTRKIPAPVKRFVPYIRHAIGQNERRIRLSYRVLNERFSVCGI